MTAIDPNGSIHPKLGMVPIRFGLVGEQSRQDKTTRDDVLPAIISRRGFIFG